MLGGFFDVFFSQNEFSKTDEFMGFKGIRAFLADVRGKSIVIMFAFVEVNNKFQIVADSFNIIAEVYILCRGEAGGAESQKFREVIHSGMVQEINLNQKKRELSSARRYISHMSNNPYQDKASYTPHN